MSLVAAFCALPAAAQVTARTAPLPTDTAVHRGALPNGLHFIIRRNLKPEKRAELRLVVNAGSILETDAQRGLAHYVEHMAFNGTKRFPRSDIVNFLERSGMRFGADLNASTSFDQTIYMLQIPTDSAGLLPKGLDIMVVSFIIMPLPIALPFLCFFFGMAGFSMASCDSLFAILASIFASFAIAIALSAVFSAALASV